MPTPLTRYLAVAFDFAPFAFVAAKHTVSSTVPTTRKRQRDRMTWHEKHCIRPVVKPEDQTTEIAERKKKLVDQVISYHAIEM